MRRQSKHEHGFYVANELCGSFFLAFLAEKIQDPCAWPHTLVHHFFSFSGFLLLLVQTLAIVRQQVQHPFSPHPHSFLFSSPFFLRLGTITPQQHSWLTFLLSTSSPCLSFIHPSTRPCCLLLLLTPYLSTAEIPLTFAASLSLCLFLRMVGVTMVAVQAKSLTACPVCIKSCWDWREKCRDGEQQQERREKEGGSCLDVRLFKKI